jgi:ribosomal protein L34
MREQEGAQYDPCLSLHTTRSGSESQTRLNRSQGLDIGPWCALPGAEAAPAAHTDHGFVARLRAKIGKMTHAMQRIHGFVARVRAKIGEMTHAMQRISGFVARPGAQQGEKVLCVQCMQRIHGFVARVRAKMVKLPRCMHIIRRFCALSRDGARTMCRGRARNWAEPFCGASSVNAWPGDSRWDRLPAPWY